MATTTSIATEPRVINLSNGKSFTVSSNQSTTAESIPVIDVQRMYSDDIEERKALAEEVREASREIGFFTMINHVSLHACISAAHLLMPKTRESI
jgi:hypothetical protein